MSRTKTTHNEPDTIVWTCKASLAAGKLASLVDAFLHTKPADAPMLIEQLDNALAEYDREMLFMHGKQIEYERRKHDKAKKSR